MPEDNVSKKPKGVHVYVYHIGKGYRNDKGKSTSKQTLIGKFDEASNRLFPNDNYFEIFGGSPLAPSSLSVDAIKNYGNYYLLSALIRDYQMDTLVKRVFGDLADDILMLAIYMALEGNVLYNCEDFMEETLTGFDHIVNATTKWPEIDGDKCQYFAVRFDRTTTVLEENLSKIEG
jgi:hypothetical protein